MKRLATFKHISSKNADYGAAEAYLTFEHDEFTMKPTLDENGRLIPREDYRISSLNCGGEDFDNAHTAEADTVATYEVLKAQLDRYDTLKNDVKALASYVPKRYVDFAGYLIYDDKGEPTVNFGKHKGKTAREVFNTEPSYFRWIQQGSFSLETKATFASLEEKFKLEKLADKFNMR